MPPKPATPPSTSNNAPVIDPDVLAAAVAAALAHIQTTTKNTSRSLPEIPRFVHDPCKPNGTSRWFQQLDSLFRLQTVTDADKCALAVNALDSSIFDKVACALLPAEIETLDDYQKLRDTMVGLFDYSVSIFASRYAALNLEWKGPENESIAELGSRLESAAAAFKDVSAEEMKTLMLMMSMKERGLEGFRLQVLHTLNKKPDTSLAECLGLMNTTLQAQREQKLPVHSSVNYVKRKEHKPAHSSSRHDRRGDTSSAHGNRGRRSNSSSSRDSKASSTSSKSGHCDSCGGSHPGSSCRYRDAVCYSCGKMGHIKRICKTNGSSNSKTATTARVNTVRVDTVRINSVRAKSPSACSNDHNSGDAAPYSFRTGDLILWYNSCDESWHRGLFVERSNGLCEVRHGEYNQKWAIVDKEDVIPYDPALNNVPATSPKASTTFKK